MAHQGQEIENPRTGQRMRFVELRPERLRIESVSPVTHEREPLHIHPLQESRAEVVSGSLAFEVDGVEHRLEPADSLTIPAGTPHRFWNDGDRDAHSIQVFEPALRIADFFETLFALAAANELAPNGMPHLLQLAVMAPEFRDEIRPTNPPWPLLRAISLLLGPIARRRGYRPVRSLG